MAPFVILPRGEKLINYKSRSTLYRLKRDGWFDPYIINYACKDHLDMKPKGKPKSGAYIDSIIEWRPSTGNRIKNQHLNQKFWLTLSNRSYINLFHDFGTKVYLLLKGLTLTKSPALR